MRSIVATGPEELRHTMRDLPAAKLIAQAAALRVGQPLERLALDINEVGDFKDLVQTRETTARPGGVSGCQDGDSSGGREGGTERNLSFEGSSERDQQR